MSNRPKLNVRLKRQIIRPTVLVHRKLVHPVFISSLNTSPSEKQRIQKYNPQEVAVLWQT